MRVAHPFCMKRTMNDAFRTIIPHFCAHSSSHNFAGCTFVKAPNLGASAWLADLFDPTGGRVVSRRSLTARASCSLRQPRSLDTASHATADEGGLRKGWLRACSSYRHLGCHRPRIGRQSRSLCYDRRVLNRTYGSRTLAVERAPE